MIRVLATIIVCVFAVIPGILAAACTDTPQSVLHCIYEDWKSHSDPQKLNQLLDSLFFTYITDGTDRTLRSFFDGMRKNDPPFESVFRLKRELIERYTFNYPEKIDASAMWAMQPRHAERLFLLAQTEPQSVPFEITAAMQMVVYEKMDLYFQLSALRGRNSVHLPAQEYARLLEVLKRMSWVHDPFLRATNHYYQGLIYFKLHDWLRAVTLLVESRHEFYACLQSAEAKLSKKRILGGLAETNLALGQTSEAEADYLSILKLDPQDWNALINLSYLLNKRGECTEPGIWVEALIRSNEELFEITVHCGNRELPEEQLPDTKPLLAEFTERVCSDDFSRQYDESRYYQHEHTVFLLR